MRLAEESARKRFCQTENLLNRLQGDEIPRQPGNPRRAPATCPAIDPIVSVSSRASTNLASSSAKVSSVIRRARKKREGDRLDHIAGGAEALDDLHDRCLRSQISEEDEPVPRHQNRFEQNRFQGLVGGSFYDS
jgi:hypothetical protein